MAFDETRRVLFEFVGESGDLQSELRGTARDAGKADKASQGFAGTLKGKVKPAAIAAGAAAAAMAAKWAIDGIALAETAEVMAASFDKTFGPAADSLTESMEQQRIALGLSESEWQKQATAIGAAQVSMGATSEQAAETTEQILRVAADVAAFNGELAASPEVIDAINGALAGSYETLDRYGISITAAMVETRALADSGKSASSELTELEKRTAAVALITEQAALSEGSLAEQMDSAAVKSNQFAARMKDVQTEVGAALLPLKELVLEVLLALVPILEALNPLIRLLGNLIGGLVQIITPVINVVAKLTQGLSDLINKAATALTKLNPFSGMSLPSFHSGGTVPGAKGTLQPVMAQGGETIGRPGAAMAGGAGAGGPSMVVNVNAGISSPDDVARAIVDQLERYTQTYGPVDIKTKG